jgi:hypothetical protein
LCPGNFLLKFVAIIRRSRAAEEWFSYIFASPTEPEDLGIGADLNWQLNRDIVAVRGIAAK